MAGNLTGFGQELVKVVAMTSLIDKLRVPSSLMANITIVPITGQSATIPEGLGDIQWRSGDPGAGLAAVSISESERGTGEITWVPNTLSALVAFPDKFMEDSILDLSGFLTTSLIDSLSEQGDQAILMGDKSTGATGNVNSDDAAPATDAFFKWFKGIATYCLNTGGSSWYNDTNAVLALTHFDQVSSAIGKYGVGGNPCIALNPITSVFTKNLMGVQAMTNIINGEISNGQLISVSGLKAIITSGMKRTEADGKMSVTTANNTEMNCVAFNGDKVLYGARRELKIESFRIYQNLNNAIIASLRADLQFANLADTGDGVPLFYMYQKSAS